MQILAPDILADACRLSVPINVGGAAVGFLIWLKGWRWHRFWLVLLATLTAGLLGLEKGSDHGMPPLAWASLLALTAGTLVIALLRGLAFAAGALAAWLTLQALTPTWDQPLVCVLVGGLLGLLLFRLWIMVLTSFAGTLLLAYCSLSLAGGQFKVEAWAAQQSDLLNVACAGLTGLGVLCQWYLERFRTRKAKERKRHEELEEEARRLAQEDAVRRKKGWFGRNSAHRRAG
jgi:uncharacterized membrane protein YccC